MEEQSSLFLLKFQVMNNEPETIFIVDDDNSIRRSLSLFLLTEGYNVEVYTGAEEYLERESFRGCGCLLLDVKMKGKSGLELQDELSKEASNLPIIFISGQGDIPMSVSALKKGAVNFLEKPFKMEDILKSVSEAFVLSRQIKVENEDNQIAMELISSLSPRENEVCKYLMSGMLNKQIAYELDIAEQTVKIHRHKISEKLGVKSVPEITRIADRAGLIPFEKKY